jgi:predicted enzyme related to lactoylglutathione lyase
LREVSIACAICSKGGRMIGRIWSVTLTVSDLRRAIGFYEGVLGLTKKYEFNDYAASKSG